ncbi:hypothetical protein A3D84_05980 [Candidatus Woesebacteria bacterium RIFCSPHIGHO2_02_FULL_42_20]|uniref:DUF5658 domain-containing protein n=1 Tax=Candidatus Woesebacteria bacterium RIFCSPHIGHO2_12_FULL_41_24 TaxID=1802510 RepID=A0A1F8AUY4_9BACT|nr:MAG: hypothetical protein A2873_02965 [Candidatus Woesebacteria bacterium RIFCSPHIGHO2_01_FULL_42_80]OGM35357.1 MAG: hypothetical protein A3D84_05980 [Candidatus Woesebacteria bacterium RIFCSPHIGHO2_02_FULL_42_20]OGM55573.1 MAG: hypothetical protein A3E44_04900 [Candidatus Woesebacteria bacterium RIFCSPHIGHO2_12_FULL_41_24]OGM71664.1 MAG: hypothetical protein A3I55_00170 [Candidatus Woesebacteria bacterium RIFCSPLOWO2_02_FULL_42_10]OGM72125.1 MAG: hypothetical protein A3H21_04145 [Candidatus
MGNANETIQDVQLEAQQNPSNLATRFIERLSQKWDSLPPEKRVYFTQLGLMVAVQAVDTLTTYAAFQTVPGAMEQNPVAGFFLDKGGMVALGLAKMGVAAGQITAMELLRNKMLNGETTPINNNIMRFWNSVLTAVSVNNAAHLLMK